MTPSNRDDLLYRLSQTISSNLDLEELLEGVMNEAVKATIAERGFIMLSEPIPVDSIPKRLYFAPRGIDQAAIENPDFQYSMSIIDQVLQSGNPILTSNAQSLSHFSQGQNLLF